MVHVVADEAVERVAEVGVGAVVVARAIRVRGRRRGRALPDGAVLRRRQEGDDRHLVAAELDLSVLVGRGPQGCVEVLDRRFDTLEVKCELQLVGRCPFEVEAVIRGDVLGEDIPALIVALKPERGGSVVATVLLVGAPAGRAGDGAVGEDAVVAEFEGRAEDRTRVAVGGDVVGGDLDRMLGPGLGRFGPQELSRGDHGPIRAAPLCCRSIAGALAIEFL